MKKGEYKIVNESVKSPKTKTEVDTKASPKNVAPPKDDASFKLGSIKD
jgi:hypothetical protein